MATEDQTETASAQTWTAAGWSIQGEVSDSAAAAHALNESPAEALEVAGVDEVSAEAHPWSRHASPLVKQRSRDKISDDDAQSKPSAPHRRGGIHADTVAPSSSHKLTRAEGNIMQKAQMAAEVAERERAVPAQLGRSASGHYKESDLQRAAQALGPQRTITAMPSVGPDSKCEVSRPCTLRVTSILHHPDSMSLATPGRRLVIAARDNERVCSKDPGTVEGQTDSQSTVPGDPP